MNVQVKYTAQLRSVLQRAEETIELPAGASLADLTLALAKENPAARAHLLSSGGQVNTCLLIVVNNVAVAAADAPATRLSAGDVVLLLPPIAGG